MRQTYQDLAIIKTNFTPELLSREEKEFGVNTRKCSAKAGSNGGLDDLTNYLKVHGQRIKARSF